MAKLIGQITYPEQEGLQVEYAKLYDENEGTTLEFRLVNRGKKTVNAYRVDISHTVNGEEKTSSVQGKNLELIDGSFTDIISCTLDKGVEEGTITLSAVIYEDLSHEREAPAFPFASFDTVSRVAETVLSGGTTVTESPAAATVTAATAQTAQPAHPAKESLMTIAKGESTAPASAAVKAVQEQISVKKSHLPLILALSALGGIILTFILRLFAFHFIAPFGETTLGEMFLIVSLVCFALFTGCAALALTAILIRPKNYSHNVAVILISCLTLLNYLYFTALMSVPIFAVSTILLVIVFLILALVKKNTALLVTTLSMALLVLLLVGTSDGCDIGCAGAQEAAPETIGASTTVEATPNTPAVTERETDTYFVLEYEQISSDECMVSGYYTCTYASNDYSTPEPYYIPVLNDIIDLTIPEYSPYGLRVVGIADEAFQWNETIRSVTLPTGITTIGETAFANCTRLENVKGLENVVEIKAHAFRQCPQLKEVSLGEGLQSIGFQAFAASGLVRVYLPDTLSSINTMAFASCTDLYEVEIRASISAIPTSFFAGCSALHTVKIPDSVERIDTDAFYNCFSLTNVFYEGSEESWNQIDISSGNDALYNANVEFHVQ